MKVLIIQTKPNVSIREKDQERIAECLKENIENGFLFFDSRYSYSVIEVDKLITATPDTTAKSDCYDSFFYSLKNIYNSFLSEPIKKSMSQMDIVNKINKHFGIQLFDWQINYIFKDCAIPREIKFARRAGKTFAAVLKLCLSQGEPINLNPKSFHYNENISIIRSYADEDGFDNMRLNLFKEELKMVYDKLKEIDGLTLREIYF